MILLDNFMLQFSPNFIIDKIAHSCLFVKQVNKYQQVSAMILFSNYTSLQFSAYTKGTTAYIALSESLASKRAALLANMRPIIPEIIFVSLVSHYCHPTLVVTSHQGLQSLLSAKI